MGCVKAVVTVCGECPLCCGGCYELLVCCDVGLEGEDVKARKQALEMHHKRSRNT